MVVALVRESAGDRVVFLRYDADPVDALGELLNGSYARVFHGPRDAELVEVHRTIAFADVAVARVCLAPDPEAKGGVGGGAASGRERAGTGSRKDELFGAAGQCERRDAQEREDKKRTENPHGRWHETSF